MTNLIIERSKISETLNEGFTAQQVVEIKEKSVYGGTLLYPNNQTAMFFAELVNKKTFSRRDLSIMADLGYRIEIIKL
jgi:hypothetical protein